MAHKIDLCKTTKQNFQRFAKIWRKAHNVTLSEKVDDTEPFYKYSIIPITCCISDSYIYMRQEGNIKMKAVISGVMVLVICLFCCIF